MGQAPDLRYYNNNRWIASIHHNGPGSYTGLEFECLKRKVKHTKLSHWGLVTHICVNYVTIIGSYIGLLPGQRQAIIWTNDKKLLIGPLRTNLSEIIIKIFIQENVFENVVWKMLAILSQPRCANQNLNISLHTGHGHWIHHNKLNKSAFSLRHLNLEG